MVNFLLNIRIVTASFGTEAFNTQVAHVNAITRIALGIPEFAAWGIALSLVYYAIYTKLPRAPEDLDFWDRVELREVPTNEKLKL